MWLNSRNRVRELRSIAESFIDSCAAAIENINPKVLGFSSTFQQNLASLALAKQIKARKPDIFIAFGGANCEGEMGRGLFSSFPFLDAVVSGPGEVVFPALVSDILANKTPQARPGVSLRTATEPPLVINTASHWVAPEFSSMDQLPTPDYTHYFEAVSRSPFSSEITSIVTVELSRGCWWGAKHHCTFCGLNGQTMAFREKSEERVLAELDEIGNRHPGLSIQVVDNIMPPRFFETVIPRLAARIPKLALFYEVKANLKKDQVRLLADAGVTNIQPGIESLNTAILNLMNKGVSAAQNIQLLKWCKQYDVTPSWNMLWGFPEEQQHHFDSIERIVPLLHHLLPPVGFGHVRMDRFSPLYENARISNPSSIVPLVSYTHLYPGLTFSQLQKIAYYFSEPIDGSHAQVWDYSALERRLHEWKSVHRRSFLTYFKSGDRVVILDTRSEVLSRLLVLEGLFAEIFILVESIESPVKPSKVSESITSESSLSPMEAIGLLLEYGILLNIDDRLISLCTSLDEQRGSTDLVYARLVDLWDTHARMPGTTCLEGSELIRLGTSTSPKRREHEQYAFQ